MKAERPIFSTRWKRVGFCLLPANGSFNLTKQVDRNEGLTTLALSRGAVITADGLAEEVTGLTDVVLGRRWGSRICKGGFAPDRNR